MLQLGFRWRRVAWNGGKGNWTYLHHLLRSVLPHPCHLSISWYPSVLPYGPVINYNIKITFLNTHIKISNLTTQRYKNMYYQTFHHLLCHEVFFSFLFTFGPVNLCSPGNACKKGIHVYTWTCCYYHCELSIDHTP